MGMPERHVTKHALRHVTNVAEKMPPEKQALGREERREYLFRTTCRYIELKSKEREDFAERVGLETTAQVYATVDEYMLINEFRLPSDSASLGGLMAVKAIIDKHPNFRTLDKGEQLATVCYDLEKKYTQSRLEQYLRQMRLSSIAQVGTVIDIVLAYH